MARAEDGDEAPGGGERDGESGRAASGSDTDSGDGDQHAAPSCCAGGGRRAPLAHLLERDGPRPPVDQLAHLAFQVIVHG